jgi:hypothetical protein
LYYGTVLVPFNVKIASYGFDAMKGSFFLVL